MINENQKKLINEINDPNSILSLEQRMQKVIQLLYMLVDDNTIEKTAKETLLRLLKEDEEVKMLLRVNNNSNNNSHAPSSSSS